MATHNTHTWVIHAAFDILIWLLSLFGQFAPRTTRVAPFYQHDKRVSIARPPLPPVPGRVLYRPNIFSSRSSRSREPEALTNRIKSHHVSRTHLYGPSLAIHHIHLRLWLYGILSTFRNTPSCVPFIFGWMALLCGIFAVDVWSLSEALEMRTTILPTHASLSSAKRWLIESILDGLDKQKW